MVLPSFVECEESLYRKKYLCVHSAPSILQIVKDILQFCTELEEILHYMGRRVFFFIQTLVPGQEKYVGMQFRLNFRSSWTKLMRWWWFLRPLKLRPLFENINNRNNFLQWLLHMWTSLSLWTWWCGSLLTYIGKGKCSFLTEKTATNDFFVIFFSKSTYFKI